MSAFICDLSAFYYFLLMRVALLILSTLLFATCLFAQHDSLNALRIYQSLLQEQTLPALAADNGKHVVQVNTVYQVNSIRTVEQPFQTFRATYRTQWRKHGFGVVYEGIPGSTIWSNSMGLQYGYGIQFKQHWLRNTKLSVGASVHFVKMTTDFSQMIFVDQIDTANGVVRPSGEMPITNSVNYGRYEAGLFLRSRKLFLGVNVDNLNEPIAGFYKTSQSQLASTLIINAGVKLMESKRLSSWVTYDQWYSKNQLYMRPGITFAYQNKYLLTCYMAAYSGPPWAGPHFRFGYINNHIRAFVQYQYTGNDYVGYFGYGHLSFGMAYAIGKQ